MKKTAIIFDLDGVIVHTDEFHYTAWKKLADKLGIEFNREDSNRLRGVSRMESLEVLLEKSNVEYSIEEKLKFAEEKNEDYIKFLDKMSKQDVSKEVYDTLILLKEKGIKLAIGSSSKNARLILKKIGIIGLFDVIIDGTNITNSKPDPEVFVKAQQGLLIDKENCVVVEDAVSGIMAGYGANIDTIAIGDAKNTDFANYKINSFVEIYGIVCK